MKVSVVDEKQVKRRKLILAFGKKDGWILKFKDDVHPYAYYFGDGEEARSAFDRIGDKMNSESHFVVELMSDRFAKTKKRCPIGFVEVRGKCVKTMPVKTHHHSDELSELSPDSSPPEVLRARVNKVVAKILKGGK